MIEYLYEIKTIFENTLTLLAGAKMESEKNWGVKILWHTPFKQFNLKEQNQLLLWT